MADFHPGSLLPEAAAYITSPGWLALFRTCKFAPGNRTAVPKILNRRLHLHLSTEGLPVPPCGVTQWYRLGAETGVRMALVRNLHFHSFTEILGDEATSWPQKCHTYGAATRCDPQRHSLSRCLLKKQLPGWWLSFSAYVSFLIQSHTKYFVSALIWKLKLL